MKFTKLLIALLFFSAVLAWNLCSPPDAKAQDTTFYTIVKNSITFSFTMDSTGSTVTDWFPGEKLNTQHVYFSHKYTDTFFGKSANADTMRCIIQMKDEQGNVYNSDTVGAGSEGSEILVSTGTGKVYLTNPKVFAPYWRLQFENVVTGGHKNGNGTEVGTLYGVPTYLK